MAQKKRRQCRQPALHLSEGGGIDYLRANRFIEALLREKLISEKKARQLLGWTHSGFSLDAGEKPVAAHDVDGRRRLAEYLLRAPFSLEKITWNETSRKVIYRSKRSWHTKKNFQIFEVTDFLAAAVEHIPPKGQQTVRYYGLYSNKRRGMDARTGQPRPTMREAARAKPAESGSATLFVLPPPEPKSARALRPLWRDLIQKIWGEDPMICPCCKGTMKTVGTMIRRDEVEFFLRLHGLWVGVLALPPPPRPPFDIEKRRGPGGVLDGGEAEARRVSPRAGRANQTLEPLDMPSQWGLSDEIEPPPEDCWRGEEAAWQAPELPLDDGRVLVLDADDPYPADEWPVYRVD